jgi:sulfur-oxidizing protein SoxY
VEFSIRRKISGDRKKYPRKSIPIKAMKAFRAIITGPAGAARRQDSRVGEPAPRAAPKMVGITMRSRAVATGRRTILKAGGALGVWSVLVASGVLSAGEARAATDRTPFQATTLEEAFAALGAGRPDASSDIELSLPDIAENGAMVPIGVVSRLPGTEQMAILVQKNPNKLAAVFDFAPDTLPELQTRIRMAESSDVLVLVKTAAGFHLARRPVRVTIGGCAA